MERYIEIRECEKRLIARLERLGYPMGMTMRVLAKVVQCRGEVARGGGNWELGIKNGFAVAPATRCF